MAISVVFLIISFLAARACFVMYTTDTCAFQLVADAVNVTLSSASNPYITLQGWSRVQYVPLILIHSQHKTQDICFYNITKMIVTEKVVFMWDRGRQKKIAT